MPASMWQGFGCGFQRSETSIYPPANGSERAAVT
jgi:hypothetical protein